MAAHGWNNLETAQLLCFNSVSPTIDGLIWRIISTSDTYAKNLGLPNQPIPSYAHTSLVSAISTFPTHNVCTVDTGFDCSTNAFHWAAVSRSVHNLPSLILEGTGNAMSALQAELLAMSFLIQSITSKHNSQIVILVDCLAIARYFPAGDNCFIDSILLPFCNYVKSFVDNASIVLKWIPRPENFLAHSFAELAGY